MEKEWKEKEKEIIVKKINPKELEELKRLHSILDQAPNRKIGTINLKDQAMKNTSDYHLALSEKYQFDPTKIGINRHTGDLQLLPNTKPEKQQSEEEVLKKLKELESKFKSKIKHTDPKIPMTSHEWNDQK